MITYIGDISVEVPSISLPIQNRVVNDIFEQSKDIQGVVVVKDDIPIGLISKVHFYQNMGTMYGYHLYMGRSAELLMNKAPLIVDYYTTIVDVSTLAMSRKDEEIYDYIIVTKDSYYVGVVSVRHLLITFAEIQTENASVLDPLTRLPGNSVIHEKLTATLSVKQFSVLCVDLDYFKSYNDIYGFKRGDDLLTDVSKILHTNIAKNGGFLGHIGGDDFVAIFHHFRIDEICQTIIQQFEAAKKFYYPNDHFTQKYVISENRRGNIEKIPLISISITVVTNQTKSYINVEEIVSDATKVKKLCKSTPQSCYEVSSSCLTN